MERNFMIELIKENPGIEITHSFFGDDEYIYQKEDGKIYDENGYLFEDWYSEGLGQHNGIRIRKGGEWEFGWRLKKEYGICKKLSKTNSGKSYLYSNLCKTCQYNRICPYM